MARLETKVAVITGAASGIGLATAELFLEQGARVMLVDRDEKALKSAIDELESDQLRSFAADVANREQVEAYIRAAKDEFGSIDCAVFNAGISGVNMPLEDYPVEVFDQVIAVNMRAAWLGLRTVIPLMKEQGRGSIILTSSIQGLAALARTTAYTTSKHALVGMMKGVALELAPSGVRVNCVHPGYVATQMMDRIHGEMSPDSPGDIQTALSASVPMGRYAKPEEIARLMLFLASDESSYSTGASFVADGGLLAALPT